MTRMLSLTAPALGLAALSMLARAAPVPLFGINLGSGDESSTTPVAVSQDTITTNLTRPAQFSRAAYCPTATVNTWTCAQCGALGSNVKVLASGGDNQEIPQFFVASDPDTQTIVVAHQGTDPKEILSIANDVEFTQVAANSTLFPQASSDVLLHSGFQDTQGRTADVVLSTVQSALSSTGFTNVLVTGHSLGAAVASLDTAMLRMALPDSVNINSVVFGLPRVGNQAWADLLDSLIPNFAHVTNQNDPVPTVPPHFLSFEHPAGELHIQSVDGSSGDAQMVACPGLENQDCSAGNSVLDTSVENHLGPYFGGISFGGKACTS